jgi:ribonuclease HI
MIEETNKDLVPEVEIYTDGGCEPNPGVGGFGVVLCHPKKRTEFSGGFRLTTNNRMEIYAAIKGLELLKKPCKVRVYSDSQYVVNAMMEGWVTAWKKRDWWRTNQERAVNIDLWQRLLELCQIHQVAFCWVKGHAGHQENERCDQLSCAALRQPNLPADEGYENKPEIQEGRPRLNQEGQACWKCGTPVVKQKSQKRSNREFYYEFYLYCAKCQATYEVAEAKRLIEQPPNLFDLRGSRE